MNNTKNVIIVLIIIIILLVNILLMFPKKKVYEHLGLNDAILDYGIDMPDAAEALGIDDIRIYIPSIGSIAAGGTTIGQFFEAIGQAPGQVATSVANITDFSGKLSSFLETLSTNSATISQETPLLIKKFAEEDLEKIYLGPDDMSLFTYTVPGYTVKQTAEDTLASLKIFLNLCKDCFSLINIVGINLKAKRPIYITQSCMYAADRIRVAVSYGKYFLKYHCYIHWHNTYPKPKDIFNKQEYKSHIKIISTSALNMLLAVSDFLPSTKLIIDTFKPIIDFITAIAPSPKGSQLSATIARLDAIVIQSEKNSLRKIKENIVDALQSVPSSTVDIEQVLYTNYTILVTFLTIPPESSYAKNQEDIQSKIN